MYKVSTNPKNKITAISLIIMFAFGSMAVLSFATAALDVETHAWIAVSPNPTGINQQVLVTFWVLPLSPTFDDTPTGEHYQGYMVTITKPDGNQETKGPYTPPAIGSTYFLYTPTQTGTYTFKFNYPGQTMRDGNNYLPSEKTTELVVQQDPIPYLPDLPGPSGYWTRPISGETRGWGSVTGPWLMTNYDAFNAPFGSEAGYNPYTEAPKSAHILWTKQIASGGIAGGQLGDLSFYPGLSYELRLSPPIIMDGKLYYNLFPNGFAGAPTPNGWACVNLRTGEELYRVMDDRLTTGQQIFISDANQLGVFQYVWTMMGSTWRMYDAMTGTLVAKFENATSGKITFDNTGNMLVYLFTGQWAGMWNLTKCVPFIMRNYYMWTPAGTYNWLDGMQWNMTVPYSEAFMGSTRQSLQYFNGEKGVAIMQTFNGGPARAIGYDFTDNQIRLLWVQDREFNSITCFGAIGKDVYVQLNSADSRLYAYSLISGEVVWITDPPGNAWATQPGNPTIADGKLYSPTYDGYVHVYDVSDGHEIYSFFGSKSIDVPYGQYPFYTGPIIGGDVAFVPTMEHSPSMPLYKGERLYAFNKDTGEPVWNISGFYQTGAIAEGNLILYNAYDGRIYNFGKGPSATTVSAPQLGAVVGQSVMITGTVTDQSAGQKDTAAISDQDMSDWMEYLYMNHAIPDSAKGVQVKLSATDENGQVTQIGEVTSQMSGVFGCKWNPSKAGTYKITATFEGSESYGGSYAETYMVVDQAPSASPIITPTSSPTSPATTTTPTIQPTLSPSEPIPPDTQTSNDIYIIAAVAAVIIIVAASAAVLLRRRK